MHHGGSVLNKVNELRREPVMRNIFGQEHNKLDIAAIIRDRGILIVNLAKSEVGRENARLIGAFIVSQLTLHAAARMQALARRVGEDPEAAAREYPDFYVYADEFQDLATARFDDALSQSRNGRVAFALQPVPGAALRDGEGRALRQRREPGRLRGRRRRRGRALPPVRQPLHRAAAHRLAPVRDRAQAP